VSGTLPETAGSAPRPHDPRRLSRWSLWVGLASLVLGFIWLVPIAGIVLGVLGRAREPLGRRLATWGIVLAAVSLVLWIAFVGPLLDLIGFV
jgi:hypothetical protein